MPSDARAAAADRLADLLTGPAADHDGFLDTLGDTRPLPSGPAAWLAQWPAYELAYEFACGARPDEAVRLLALRPGGTVLDLGCGTGRFTRAFADAVAPYGLAIGLDAATPLLRRAAAAGPPGAQLAYLRADPARPPLGESTVDAVCCFGALHLFADPLAALTSAAALLVPDGRIAIRTSARRAWEPAGTVESVTGALTGRRVFEREDVAAMLAWAGFDDIRVQVVGGTQTVTAHRA